MPIPTLTAAQITRLRGRPHRTRVWLSIFQPGTVLAARIAHVGIAKGERVINITGLGGDANSVMRGMTCHIGTTPGGRDLGRIRAISATAGTLTVAENAVTWVSGWYLTVVEYFEPWAVFPRIVLQDNIPIFYKDYDIAYTNQNTLMDPVVCMGPNHAGFLITGAFAVYYSSSGSFDPTNGQKPTGWLWNFEGGTPSGSAEPDPGWVQYTGAGHFLTTLRATTDAGKTLTGHRHVSIYTRPDEGPAFPILKWGMRSFEGSRDQGGYAVRFFLRESADFARVAEGSLVVLFTDDWEAGVPGKAASGAENRSSILFNGYIEDDSVTVDPETNVLEFNAVSITQIMQRLSTYSWALDEVETAVNWTQMPGMTVDKAVIHFLRTQSTVMEVADYSWTGDAKMMQYADFGRGDLYASANGLYASALLGLLVADRQGKMWAEMDAMLVTTGSSRLTALGAGFPVTRQDWRGNLNWNRQQDDALAYLEYGGIYYSGPSSTGSSLALLGVAPGDVAGYHGSVERTSGLVILDQNALNVLVGLGYAKANAEFPELSIPMAGDYRLFDIAPQSRLLLTMAASENWRGLAWDSKPFVPQAISYQVMAGAQMMMMDVRAREETHGVPGTTLIIPVEPPYDDSDLPTWEIEFPPIMPWPPILPPIVPQPPETEVVFVLNVGQLFRCNDIQAASPVWYAVGIPGGSYVGSIVHFWLNIYNPMDQAFIWSQYSTGDPATQGPYGYLVSGLQSTTTSWSNIWNATQNQILEPGGLSRQMMFIGQSLSLGYFIGGARQADLGSSKMVRGSIGSWEILTGGSNVAVGGFGTGVGGNMGHLGGTTLAAAGAGSAGRSDNLGSSWLNDAGPGGVRQSNYGLASDGIRCIWGHRDVGAGYDTVFHHANGMSPGNTIYDIATDISPVIGGTRYGAAGVANGSWHTYKSIINGGDRIYMHGTGGGDYAWFVKDSWLPTNADWHYVYSLGADWRLWGVDVNLLDPTHIVANHLKGVTAPGHIWYSQNGGVSWQDKTGNLAALGWNANQVSTCKFALSSAAMT